ncbi:phosphoribosylformylglycinamidine cyclo-ligase [Corynebacterium liangguodongii]|uniref:Phosphoribosylformylglycinamidine cyclo-ligase n=1 Tax=Corynebacterium liangguodongii TaxID=2079535 RepID=A0A2S0WFV8_9CORY|nr:phosphoribosylformylglycinamidine cyclo-ligase [Corynebacterium liangguodongii]AWB84614.1 phosphoribosylformylglycinamidine cyclo-ligase [Corynebacterium liangguodongii]PWB99622.1 phosphoribosylformylglycinamidine cyclo-ligase [Corynebacterium liangguodongii]
MSRPTTPPNAPHAPVSYEAAGVSIEAGDRAVELFAPLAQRASRPEVRGGLGGFAGLFALGKYREPLLAAGSDGVGTKLAVAQAMDIHDTIGIDLVAMCVDDLVVCGAEPLFLQDYIAIGKVYPEKVAGIVSGIAEGCVQAGCALLGGETAEHPGVMGADDYDVSATAVGVVEADELLGPHRVGEGDVIIAMASSGLHSNGYSLARHVLLERAGLALDAHVDELGRTLGEELLVPTRIYALDCLALAAECSVRTFCHVTGGGLVGNMERIIPEGKVAQMHRSTWTPGPIFSYIKAIGEVPQEEMEKTFNMGIGMVAVVAPEDRDRALAILAARHIESWVLGEVRAAGEGEHARAALGGSYPQW